MFSNYYKKSYPSNVQNSHSGQSLLFVVQELPCMFLPLVALFSGTSPISPCNRYIKRSSRTTSSMKSLLMAPSRCNFPFFNCPHPQYFIGSVYFLHLIWRQTGLFPLLDNACLCRGRNSASFSCSFSLMFGERTWVWSQERDS